MFHVNYYLQLINYYIQWKMSISMPVLEPMTYYRLQAECLYRRLIFWSSLRKSVYNTRKTLIDFSNKFTSKAFRAIEFYKFDLKNPNDAFFFGGILICVRLDGSMQWKRYTVRKNQTLRYWIKHIAYICAAYPRYSWFYLPKSFSSSQI